MNEHPRDRRTAGFERWRSRRTVLDGLCGDLVIGLLVVLSLDADDDVVVSYKR